MSPATLALLGSHIRRVRPDLDNAAAAELAVRVAHMGGVFLDRDVKLHLSPEAQSLIGTPAAPGVGPGQAELAAVRGNDDRSKVRRAAIRTEMAARAGHTMTDDQLREALASVTGTDDRTRASRAALREELAARALGDDYTPTLERP